MDWSKKTIGSVFKLRQYFFSFMQSYHLKYIILTLLFRARGIFYLETEGVSPFAILQKVVSWRTYILRGKKNSHSYKNNRLEFFTLYSIYEFVVVFFEFSCLYGVNKLLCKLILLCWTKNKFRHFMNQLLVKKTLLFAPITPSNPCKLLIIYKNISINYITLTPVTVLKHACGILPGGFENK